MAGVNKVEQQTDLLRQVHPFKCPIWKPTDLNVTRGRFVCILQNYFGRTPVISIAL